MGRASDYLGKTINSWTILNEVDTEYVECQCSCGEIKNVKLTDILRGTSKSCGHGRNKPEDLTGKYFGEWYVIRKDSRRWLCKNKNGALGTFTGAQLKGMSKVGATDLTGCTFGEWEVLYHTKGRMWMCRCSCGVVKEVQDYTLKAGKSKSCGHKKTLDIIGKTFNDLTVLEYLGGKKYLCECACGNKKEVFKSNLISGSTKSCGCKMKEHMLNTTMERHGENNSKRINNPREKWQIDALASKENFIAYISKLTSELGGKPTINEISTKLDVCRLTIRNKLNEYNMYNDTYINTINDGQSSDSENSIYSYVQRLCKPKNYTVDRHNRKLIYPKELDIYVPDLKLAIEYNGSFYHQRNDMNYHFNKTAMCSNLGINLMHIFDYEYSSDNDKSIIKSLLGKLIRPDLFNNIKPEDYEIKVISNSNNDKSKQIQIDNFFSKYSLDKRKKIRYDNIVTYTAVYNNRIVAMVSFGANNQNSDMYNIMNIAYSNDCIVHEFLKNAVNRFIRDKNPSIINASHDLSKGIVSEFDTLGFNEIGISSPEYTWANTETYDSVHMSKVNDFIEELNRAYKNGSICNEYDTMELLKYYQIYNCGRIQFKWTKK